jgi:aromatic-L-amino-acid decarboxylase
LTPEEFRQRGHEMVDWIAAYYEKIASFPVLSQVRPGEIRSALAPQPPESAIAFEEVMRDLERAVLPGITHWQSPNFFAYFPANASGPSVLGDLLSSALGVQGMLWATSPACTELETHVLDWLAGMLGLPESFQSNSTGGGVIQDSASSATLCAILAARERATNFEVNEYGCRQELVAYTSTQAHSSVEKGIRAAGVGGRNLRLIEVDSAFAMIPEKLESAIEADKRTGKIPFFVCATAGTTSSLAFDPLPEIGAICRKHGVWLHLDGAMAGTAALCPEFRWVLGGIETADSFVFDAHKWMFTNFDCSCFYVADRATLIKTLTVVPEYLRNQASDSGQVFDYRDWHLPLGRRFRALKLWFVLHHYGVEGLRRHVRRHVEIAQQMLCWIQADARFEVMAPASLNLICFRLIGPDSRNEELLSRLNASGRLFLSHTRLNGKFTLRICVGQTNTEVEHAQAAWDNIRACAGLVAGI